MLKNPTIYFQLWYENASQAKIRTQTIISFSIRTCPSYSPLWGGGRFGGAIMGETVVGWFSVDK